MADSARHRSTAKYGGITPFSADAEIEQRLDAVENLLQQTILRAELRKQLGGILDLERLLAKVTLGSAGPRDLLALGRSLEKIPALNIVSILNRRRVCARCTSAWTSFPT